MPTPNHRFEPTAMSPQFPIHRQRMAVAQPWRYDHAPAHHRQAATGNRPPARQVVKLGPGESRITLGTGFGGSNPNGMIRFAVCENLADCR